MLDLFLFEVLDYLSPKLQRLGNKWCLMIRQQE